MFQGYRKVENWLTNSATHYTKKYSIGWSVLREHGKCTSLFFFNFVKMLFSEIFLRLISGITKFLLKIDLHRRKIENSSLLSPNLKAFVKLTMNL